jgi:hypothetical protein
MTATLPGDAVNTLLDIRAWEFDWRSSPVSGLAP